MKTVEVTRTFDYVPASDRRMTIRFHAGVTYTRVIDAAAESIERAGAGHVVVPDGATNLATIDVGHVWRRRRP